VSTRYAGYTDAEIVAEVLTALGFGAHVARTRAKPHRCHECGRVTRHVFCNDCRKRRAAK